MYKKVELPENSFAKMEQKVQESWKKNNIIKKNLDMNKGKRYFVFYDGPPTANGMPHVGHVETRVMKDIIARYKVMQNEYLDEQFSDKKICRFLWYSGFLFAYKC